MLTKATRQKLLKRVANRPNNKLTPAQRDEIASRYADDEDAKSLAEEYGVSLFTIYRCIRLAITRAS